MVLGQFRVNSSGLAPLIDHTCNVHFKLTHYRPDNSVVTCRLDWIPLRRGNLLIKRIEYGIVE